MALYKPDDLRFCIAKARAVADLGGDPEVQWNPPFGRVLRKGFVVVLRIIGALAIVYVTLSPSALAFTYTRAHGRD